MPIHCTRLVLVLQASVLQWVSSHLFGWVAGFTFLHLLTPCTISSRPRHAVTRRVAESPILFCCNDGQCRSEAVSNFAVAITHLSYNLESCISHQISKLLGARYVVPFSVSKGSCYSLHTEGPLSLENLDDLSFCSLMLRHVGHHEACCTLRVPTLESFQCRLL